MKKFIGLFAFLLAMFVVFSCEPNRAENGDYLFGVQNPNGTGGGNGGGSTTGRLLKKIISHEKNDETGLFEDAEMTYNYSGTKLISTKDDTGEVTTFTYNANDKIIKIQGSNQLSTYEYTNNLVSKSITEVPGFFKVTANFTYVGGRLTKTVSVQESSLPFPVKNYVETNYDYTGTNITKGTIKNGIYLPDGTLQMSPDTIQIAFTYDQKKSPYSLLPKEFIFYAAGIAPQGVAFFSPNNLTKFVTTIGGVSETVNYVYEYDSENYATKIVDGEDYTKYEYQ